jgi:hypothetical protein
VWDGQAEGFRSLEVDDQFKLGGLLDGQIDGLGALQDLIDESCRVVDRFIYWSLSFMSS